MSRLMRYRKAITITKPCGERSHPIDCTCGADAKPKRTWMLVQHGLKYQRYETTHCGLVIGGTFQVPDPERVMEMACPACGKLVALQPKGKVLR